MKTFIAPSILSADFGKLNQEIATVDEHVDLLHVDIMDGHFVNNITMGSPVVRCIRSRVPLDCHLMIEHPEKFVEAFAKAMQEATGQSESGKNSITVHAETTQDLPGILRMLSDLGVRRSVSVNPETSLDLIRGVLDDVDMVLLMTVHPGFGGQAFIPEVLEKIRELRALKPNMDIQVDGGIKPETAKMCREAGANVFVAGSFIFGADDRLEAIRLLRESVV